MTDQVLGDSTRLVRLDISASRLDLICTWIGEGTKFAVTDGRVATVADTKVCNFQFGVGTYWQVDLSTGKRSPLLCERMVNTPELEHIARTRHRPTPDAEQSSGLEDYGVVSWPTAIASTSITDSFLLVMSAGIMRVKRGQAAAAWQRFPNCAFLNLTIAAHLNDSRYLLLETVRGAQGVLWEVDIDAPRTRPKFLAGGFREPAGLVVLPDKRYILVTENLPDAAGRLWRVDLASRCKAELLRDDLDRPGEMVLLSDHSLAMITRDALREIFFSA